MFRLSSNEWTSDTPKLGEQPRENSKNHFLIYNTGPRVMQSSVECDRVRMPMSALLYEYTAQNKKVEAKQKNYQ